jgi:hypothetical protein
VIAVQPLRDRLQEKGFDTVEAALEAGAIDDTEARDLGAAKEAVDRAITVDQFTTEELAPRSSATR